MGDAWTGTMASGPVSVTPGSFYGRNITAGSTWSFKFWESFDDGGTAGVDATWSNISLTFGDWSQPTPPATAVDLGTVSDTAGNYLPDVTRNVSLAAGQVAWYKFTLNSSISLTNFLDIDTSQTTNAVDTEIALFNSAGAESLRTTTTAQLPSASFLSGRQPAPISSLALLALRDEMERSAPARTTLPLDSSTPFSKAGLVPPAPAR